MKKHFVTFALASTLALSLAGCGKDKEAEVSASPVATEVAVATQSTSLMTPGSNLTSVTVSAQAASPSDVVTIQIPQSMVNKNIANAQEAATQQNYQNAILGADNSVSLTMTQAQHMELLSKITAAIDNSFQQLINGVYTPYITNITHDADFNIITVFVDKNGYSNTFVDMTPDIVGQYAAFYQAYKGVTPNVTVKVVDNLTSNTIESFVYPSISSGSSTSLGSSDSASASSADSASSSGADSATSSTTEPKPLVKGESKKYTTTEDTKLYTETDKESKVLADIKKGTTFTSSESSEYFYKTTINGKTGFVRKKFTQAN